MKFLFNWRSDSTLLFIQRRVMDDEIKMMEQSDRGLF
jgi:hypothetical protein